MDKDLLKIIEHYGVQKQTTIWIEELSELTKEICKWQRNYEEWEGDIPQENYDNLTKEMGDVENILEQMKIVLNNNEIVQQERYIKNQRQLKRIEGEKNE